MDIKDLTTYLGNHCRFKFRNGKDIYGVIWESNAKFFFSSKERHDSLLKKEGGMYKTWSPIDLFDQINPEDIIQVERIAR